MTVPGWAPDDVVYPCELDVSSAVNGASDLRIGCLLDPRLNGECGMAWVSTNVTDARLAMYTRNAGDPRGAGIGARE